MFLIFSEGSSGMTLFYAEKLISRSCEDKMSSLITTFRADVYDSISIRDDVEIVFDHDDTVAFLYKSIEDIEEFLDIREVKPCSRLIEYIECFSCRSLGKVEGELDTLCLSSRECRCRLAESDISESYMLENIEYTKYPRKGFIEFTGFIDRHSEDFCDIFSFEFHIERLRIVSTSSTRLTLDIDIGEEVHLYLFDPTPLTDFTSTTFCIEGESSWPIPSLLCFMRSREYFTDKGKYPRISSNIGVRGLAYG